MSLYWLLEKIFQWEYKIRKTKIPLSLRRNLYSLYMRFVKHNWYKWMCRLGKCCRTLSKTGISCIRSLKICILTIRNVEFYLTSFFHLEQKWNPCGTNISQLQIIGRTLIVDNWRTKTDGQMTYKVLPRIIENYFIIQTYFLFILTFFYQHFT